MICDLSFQILHRDLAARNVLLGEGKLCKISHFGAAQDVVESRQYERAIKVTTCLGEHYHNGNATNKHDLDIAFCIYHDVMLLLSTSKSS